MAFMYQSTRATRRSHHGNKEESPWQQGGATMATRRSHHGLYVPVNQSYVVQGHIYVWMASNDVLRNYVPITKLINEDSELLGDPMH